MRFDAVIIGGGPAGLSAALTVAEFGWKPVVIEKARRIGGNCVDSPGFFNASDPRRQVKRGISDTPEKHALQSLEASRGKANEAVLKAFCYAAPEALRWLEELGVRFGEQVREVPGGAFPRTHVPEGGGRAIVEALASGLARHRVPVLLGTKAERIILRGGRAAGIEAAAGKKRIRIDSRFGVLVASGGFTRNPRLMRTFGQELEGVQKIGAEGDEGDMLLAAQDIGASVVGLSFFDIVLKTALPLRIARNPSKIVLLNREGKRFVREDLREGGITEAIFGQSGRRAWAVCHGEKGKEGKAPFTETVLEASVRRYDDLCKGGKDTDFGKAPAFLRPIGRPYRIEEVAPVVRASLGGLEISPEGEVLDRASRKPIPGLAAAGDVSGGVHGERALAGDLLAAAVSFGRIGARTLVNRGKL